MTIVITLFSIAAAGYLLYFLSRRGPPLPPGPRRLPFLGNVLDIPNEYHWIHWAKYKELYGPISSISVMGREIIIMNDQTVSTELLDKRSVNYSDRPVYPFARMAGLADITTLQQYDETLAAHRKNMRHFVGTRDALAQIHPIQELETKRFVLRVLTRPKELLEHVRLLTAAVILKVTHGYSVDTEQPDPLIGLADRASTYFAQALLPGKWIVDIFPIFKFLPEWMPGSGFKQKARSWKKCIHEMAERPHQFVKQQMAAGISLPSFESSLLERNASPEDEYIIKWAAATLYAGGADTSVSALYSFFIAMQLHPEVQTKAQAEIDSVVGPDRMPTFADRPNLPYVDAVAKEVWRWHSVVPLCAPHVAREYDTYQGFAIPKGSLLISNTWAINHDPANYNDPDTFKPERFLGVDGHKLEMDPRNVSFGYGRRICPGKDLADGSIFIAIAMCLATLNIQKARDEAGQVIEPKYEVTDAHISHPKTFPCAITARSARARNLVMLVEDEATDTHGDAAVLSSISLDL